MLTSAGEDTHGHEVAQLSLGLQGDGKPCSGKGELEAGRPRLEAELVETEEETVALDTTVGSD